MEHYLYIALSFLLLFAGAEGLVRASSSLALKAGIPPLVTTLDYATMIGFSLLLIPILPTGRIVSRREGALLLTGYGAYLFMTWPQKKDQKK